MVKKVLIVEDEINIANWIADVAEMIGLETKILPGGEKVLATAKEWRPDVITLDIMMPPPDGLEVLSQLKNDIETAPIPVIIISVIAGKVELVGKISQAEKVLSKPVDVKRLTQSLEEFMRIK